MPMKIIRSMRKSRSFIFTKRVLFSDATQGKNEANELIKASQSTLGRTIAREEIKQMVETHVEQTMDSLSPSNNKDTLLTPEEILRRLDSPAIIPLNEKLNDLMIDNPLESSSYLATNKGAISTSEDLVIRLKDNPSLGTILSERKFDLTDPSININNSAESQLFFDANATYKTISLGNATVMPKDTMLLDDIDVDNIPKNIDIQLFKSEKEFVVVGKEFADVDKNEAEIGTQERLDGEMFVEKTLEDTRKEEMNLFERILLMLDPTIFVKIAFKFLPITIFMYFFVQSTAEQAQIGHRIHEIDERQMQAFVELKKKYF